MKARAIPAVLLGLVLVHAPMAYAQRDTKDDRRVPSRFSDRDRSADWTRDKEAVEQALKPGENKEFYRKQLEQMGFTITAVNYDKPDYVEWEVVKGDKSYEVQIDMAGAKANKVDVTTNMWRADATKQAMQGKKVAAAGRSNARFSDRDRRARLEQRRGSVRTRSQTRSRQGFLSQRVGKDGLQDHCNQLRQTGLRRMGNSQRGSEL
jgi:HSP20 family molecular chaperone IbpA